MEQQSIQISEIRLEWTDWYPWKVLLLDARSNPGAVRVPNLPGVYEARLRDTEERLTIGKASNLRMRVKQGLVKGKVPHSSGKDIRASENLDLIQIRWAKTDRPAATEEELHRQYVKRFGKMPLFTDHT